jgi:hypothetical protein
MFQSSVRSKIMANVTYFVMVPFKDAEGELVAEQGVQCPSEGSAKAQARSAVAKGAVGAIAFKRSGDPNIGEYSEAVLICKEGDLPDSVMEMLAA